MSRPRPDLWRAHGERQMYVTSLLTNALGGGPALTGSARPSQTCIISRGSYGAKCT